MTAEDRAELDRLLEAWYQARSTPVMPEVKWEPPRRDPNRDGAAGCWLRESDDDGPPRPERKNHEQRSSFPGGPLHRWCLRSSHDVTPRG